MIHEINVLGCGVIYIDNERVFGSKPYGLFSTVNWSATDEDLKRIADRCLEVISDRKTENSSEKPHNCETCKHQGEFSNTCKTCSVYFGDSHYEPKDENHSGESTEMVKNCENCGTPKDKCVYCIEEDRMWTPQTERSE